MGKHASKADSTKHIFQVLASPTNGQMRCACVPGVLSLTLTLVLGTIYQYSQVPFHCRILQWIGGYPRPLGPYRIEDDHAYMCCYYIIPEKISNSLAAL